MNNAISAPRPWYREPWPWALMSGPALVIVAGIITVSYAIKSDDGLVADDYYKRGLTVNRDLARIETARERRVDIDLDLGAGEVTAIVQSASRQTLPDAIALRLAHPTRASEDVRVTMRRTQGGAYRAPIAIPPGQRWKVRLETADWLLQGEIPAGAAHASVTHAGG